MNIPGIIAGDSAFKGSIERNQGEGAPGKTQHLPADSKVGGGIAYSDKPGTDLSTLFPRSVGGADSAKKGGITGLAGHLSGATALIPGLSNVLKGIGNSDGSLGGMLGGAIGGAAQTVKQSVEGVAKGVANGEVSMTEMGKNALLNNYENNDQTPSVVKFLANLA